MSPQWGSQRAIKGTGSCTGVAWRGMSPRWGKGGICSLGQSWGRGGELTFPVHLWCTFHSYFFLLPFYFWEKDFLGGPMVKTPHFQCSGVRVWPLVRELRSHILCGTAKLLKNKTTEGGIRGLLVCKTHHMQSPCWNFVQLWTSSLVWNFQ